MLNKKLIMLTIVLVSLLAVSAVSAADNATSDVFGVDETTTDIVEVTADDTVSVENDNQLSANESNVGTFNDLVNEINVVEEGGVLNLAKDYKYVNGSTEGIKINKAITIDGQGHTLDGNNLSRIIVVNSNNIVLKNIIFVNGHSNGYGGAIKNKCSLLINCTFINNFAKRGGALDYCNAVNCTFINNSAAVDGGAIYDGSATNCIFKNNSAIYGGAISGSSGSYRNYVSSVNCTFLNNHGLEYGMGGAIFYCSASNCIFLNNRGYHGGAIGKGDATNCTFLNNSAENGGAIYISTVDNFQFTNCIFINNSAKFGGAIDGGSAINCTFSSNTAKRTGGAIDGGSAINCTFLNNSANHGGAVGFIGDKNYKVINCIFIDNFAEYGGALSGDFDSVKDSDTVYYYIFADDCIFINNCAKEDGGAVYIGIAKGCIFMNNSAVTGGAIYKGSAINSTFIKNTARGGGATAGCSADNCFFENNTAKYSGGAMMFGGGINSDLHATNCIFVNNVANSGGAIKGNVYVIFQNKEEFTFYSYIKSTNCTFLNNSAVDGGAIYVSSATNCTFLNNSAENGGAIYDGPATNCTFINNFASKIGGAFYKGRAKDCNFVNNTASISGFTTYPDDVIIIDPIFSVDVLNNINYSEDLIFYVESNINCNVSIESGIYKKNLVLKANLSSLAIFENLPVGNYYFKIIFDPINNYYSSYKTTRDISINKKETSFDLKIGNFTYGEEVVVSVNTSVDGKVHINIGNNSIEKFVYANNIENFNFGILAANSYQVNAQFDAGNNYKKTTKNVNLIISPAEAKIIDVQSANNIYGEDTIINIKTNTNGLLTIKTEYAKKIFNVTANQLNSLNIGVLDVGLHNIELSLTAGTNYTKVTSLTQVVITPKQTSINVFVKNSIYGENVIINVSASENGKIIIQIGEITKSVTVESNKITSIDFGILDAKSYAINVTFDGGTNYIHSQSVSSIEIIPKNTKINLGVTDYDIKESVIINVTSSENGVATIKLNNKIKNINVITNKVAFVDFGILNFGMYNVVANFTAGNNYVDSSDSANIKVLSKIDENDIDIKVPEIKPGQENNIVISLPADATGTVTLTIGNNSYTFNVKNGVADIKVPELSDGNYDYKINYSGDSKYSSFEKTDSINVAKPTPEIVIPPLNETSDDGSVTVNLPKDATGTITLVINGKSYSFPVVNGVANVYMPDLSAKTYSYSITYSGDSKYDSFTNTGSITVTKKSVNITASSVTTVYNGGKYIVVTLTDKDNNPMSGFDVTITINGKPSVITTDDNGQAKLSVNGIKPGIYVPTVVFSGNSKYLSATKSLKVTVKKATPKVTAAKKTFKRTLKTKKYAITLKTNQNKVMKNTKVYIKVNGKTYNAKTNSKGKATFKITKLTKKGKFNAVVTYKGNTYYNKVTKKVQITIK